MFKGLLGNRATSKTDVIMAVAGAIIGVWKAVDTIKEYKSEHEAQKEIEES